MKIRISDEVKNALDNHQAVVALESTIISHGMPYPQNYETAMLVEAEVRKNGGVPATIGIINGEPIIGMSQEEILQFAKRKGIAKASRRDLGYICSHGLWGATTVSATMIFAALAGIKVFVTGGIGGVHREGETTFDISADLEELGKTPVCVVCSGPKAILDIPLTLEYLETRGVPIIGYRSNKLASFYSSTSSYDVDYNAETPLDVAKAIKGQEDLKLKNGIIVTNPVPAEHSLPHEYIDKIVEEALKEMNKLGIKGKETTPYLLQKIAELTQGKSLAANIALILNNAQVGTLIAREYIKL